MDTEMVDYITAYIILYFALGCYIRLQLDIDELLPTELLENKRIAK